MRDDAAQPAPRVQLVPFILIGIDGLADLVAWVRAGSTLEEREQRAVFAKHAIEDLLNGVDHVATNAALREVLQRAPATSPISPPALPSTWRN